MKGSILFPYTLKEDCRSAFVFAIELARRCNAEILVLNPANDEGEPELEQIKNEKCCRLLEMKGYYHEWFQRWKAFDDVKIRILFGECKLSRLVSAANTTDHELILVLDPRSLFHMRLVGDLFTGHFPGELTVFLLPERREFTRPSPDLTGNLFQKQIQLYFNLLLSETRIYNLPGDVPVFRRDRMIRQAV